MTAAVEVTEAKESAIVADKSVHWIIGWSLSRRECNSRSDGRVCHDMRWRR